MGIIRRSFGLEAETPTSVPRHKPIILADRAGARSVTADRALSLTSFCRGVQILSGMSAQLDIAVWRNGTEIDTPSLVVQPDPWRPLSSWIERTVVNMILDGNSYCRIVRDAQGRVMSLEVLNPFAVIPQRHPLTGAKEYHYRTITGRVVVYKADEILHLWHLEVPGHEKALGPIGYARTALSGHLDVRDYSSEFFGNNDVPTGVLTTDNALDKAAAKAYKELWQDPEYGVRIVGKGLKYERIALSPADAQWLESQQFSVTDIARLLGLPADYLLAAVEGTSMTYTNQEQTDTKLLRTTLMPVYLRKIEDALSGLLPHGQTAKFRTAAFLRPDAKTRAEIEHLDIAAGVLDKEERRLREYGPRKEPIS